MGSIVNITDLVVSVPPDVRQSLYASPWTCHAVLRSLDSLAQQYILRLLLVDGPVPSGLPSRPGTCLTPPSPHDPDPDLVPLVPMTLWMLGEAGGWVHVWRVGWM